MTTEAERLADVLNLVPGGCLLVEDGIIRDANDLAVETLGIPRQRLQGTPLPELVVPELQIDMARCLDIVATRVHQLAGRIAAGLVPVEFSFRRVSEQVVLVGVRAMTVEHQMSALAGGDLTHDQVTGLPNRYHVLEQLHQRLITNAGQPLALIGVWIDDLVNLGEQQGVRVVERVSRQVGERIQARLRGPDLVGRLDDGAFLTVLTSDSPPEQLAEIADRLRNEVAFPVEYDGSLISFTASVLVASISPANRPTLEQVQARLDAVGTKLAASNGNRTEIVSF